MKCLSNILVRGIFYLSSPCNVKTLYLTIIRRLSASYGIYSLACSMYSKTEVAYDIGIFHKNVVSPLSSSLQNGVQFFSQVENVLLYVFE